MNSIKHNLGNVFSIFSDYFFQQNNNKLIEDDPDLFWKELEENQRPPLPEGPIILMGEVIADDLFSLQKQMFSSCTGASLLFVEYMKTKGLTPENVLDLGCGVGANSSLLLKHGINVIGIDKMQVLLDVYKSRITDQEMQNVSLKCADLVTLDKYSTEASVDIALAIDVFPYLPISYWKSTMEKIIASLKPSGYLFGTVFVKKRFFNPPIVAVHEQFGAQYYQISDLAKRLIRHSGLELVECRPVNDTYGSYEFVARKPIVSGTEPCFPNSMEDLSRILIPEKGSSS